MTKEAFDVHVRFPMRTVQRKCVGDRHDRRVFQPDRLHVASVDPSTHSPIH